MRMGQTRESGKTKPAYRRRKPSLTAVRLDSAAAFQSIARDCTARIAAHHSSACAGDAEAVHQIRVAITRLRAAVSFFALMTVDAEWLRLKKEIAWLNGSLGAARDTDVAVAYAGRRRYRTWARGTIGQDLDVRRLRDHRRLVRCLRSQRFRRLMEGLSDWIERGPWVARWKKAERRKPAEPLRSYSKHKLDRWHKRLIRKGRRLKTMGASRRHRLRIRAKRLRYMLEVLTDIVPVSVHGEFRRLHQPAKCLQRVLGDLRDLERFSRLGAGLVPPEGGKQGNLRPPGYRRQEEKLLVAAVEAYRGLKPVETR
jgi:CHAD domain-containing protein